MTTVSGIIRDTQGNALPGLSVRIRYLRPLVGFDGGAAVQNDRAFTTDGAGLLTMPDLVPGHYEIFISIQANASTSATLLKKGTLSVLDDGPMTLEEALDTHISVTPSVLLQAQAAAAAAASRESAAAGSASTASSAATTATTQAGIATAQAGTATTQAGIATAQAGIATTQAGTAATSTASASDSAASAQAAAISAGAPIFADTTAGLAGTSSGGFFYVPEFGGLRTYENDAGTAVAGPFVGQPVFALRSTLVAARGAGYDPAAGTVITAGGLQYVRTIGATAIADMLGWLPFGAKNVCHYGAVEGNTGNQALAFMAAQADGGRIVVSKGVYRFTEPCVLTAMATEWIFEDGAEIHVAENGPAFRYDWEDFRESSDFVAIDADVEIGVSQILMADASGFEVGQNVLIVSDYRARTNVPRCGEVTKITGIVGNVIHISNTTRFMHRASRNARAMHIPMLKSFTLSGGKIRVAGDITGQESACSLFLNGIEKITTRLVTHSGGDYGGFIFGACHSAVTELCTFEDMVPENLAYATLAVQGCQNWKIAFCHFDGVGKMFDCSGRSSSLGGWAYNIRMSHCSGVNIRRQPVGSHACGHELHFSHIEASASEFTRRPFTSAMQMRAGSHSFENCNFTGFNARMRFDIETGSDLPVEIRVDTTDLIATEVPDGADDDFSIRVTSVNREEGASFVRSIVVEKLKARLNGIPGRIAVSGSNFAGKLDLCSLTELDCGRIEVLSIASGGTLRVNPIKSVNFIDTTPELHMENFDKAYISGDFFGDTSANVAAVTLVGVATYTKLTFGTVTNTTNSTAVNITDGSLSNNEKTVLMIGGVLESLGTTPQAALRILGSGNIRRLFIQGTVLKASRHPFRKEDNANVAECRFSGLVIESKTEDSFLRGFGTGEFEAVSDNVLEILV